MNNHNLETSDLRIGNLFYGYDGKILEWSLWHFARLHAKEEAEKQLGKKIV